MSKQKIQQTEEAEATQEIPVLSVDESLSVDERFTDNAIDNILPARYLVKDEEGEVTEEPHELFERVADNVATAEFQFADEQDIDSGEAERRFEEWRKEFEELMKTQRFMPNCVSPSTTVGTPTGTKKITTIDEGDTVSDDMGSAEVAQTFNNGTKVMETITTENGYSVTSSKEHVFRVIDESGEYVWRQARNISPGDTLVLKRDYVTETEPSTLDTNYQR